MKTLTILVSGTTNEMRNERDIVINASQSLRVENTRLEVEFSDEHTTNEKIVSAIQRCDFFLGVYNQTHYGEWVPGTNQSAPEIEFDLALQLVKPVSIFVKALSANERENPKQLAFVEYAQNVGEAKLRTPEFGTLSHLKEQVAESLIAMLAQHFGLSATRPLFQAPRPLNAFVGRTAEIAQIVDALAQGKNVLIHGLHGIGGMGKTELAIHIAHLVRDQFPHGVLWTNVPSTRPIDAFTNWARVYGGLAFLGRGDLRFEFRAMTDQERKSEEITSRIDELRRVLQGKRVLVVLDGVATEQDEETLALLLRALDNSVVMVTSRVRQLRSLRNAVTVDLDCLGEEEALDLFTRIWGVEKIDGKRALVQEICSAVGYVPLALALAAFQLRERAEQSPKTLAFLLRHERERLDKENWGYGKSRAQRVVLEQSYAALEMDEQKFFTALGVLAGEDFDADAATAVANTIPPLARKMLVHLQNLGFVQPSREAGRYKLHSVLKAFARSKLGAGIAEAELRMAGYYCEIARENGRKLQDAHPAAMAILNAEISNIFAAHQWAELRFDKVGWRLCRDFIFGAMTYYFNVRAMWNDWIVWSNVGIDACRKLGDERGGVAIATSLGMVYQRKGNLEQALQFYQHALATMERLGDLQGVATVSMNLGTVQTQRGEWNEAIVLLSVALQLYERLGKLRGTAQSHANLGMLYAKHGDKGKARAHWLQALEIFEHLESRNEADVVRGWMKNLPPDTRPLLD